MRSYHDCGMTNALPFRLSGPAYAKKLKRVARRPFHRVVRRQALDTIDLQLSAISEIGSHLTRIGKVADLLPALVQLLSNADYVVAAQRHCATTYGRPEGSARDFSNDCGGPRQSRSVRPLGRDARPYTYAVGSLLPPVSWRPWSAEAPDKE